MKVNPLSVQVFEMWPKFKFKPSENEAISTECEETAVMMLCQINLLPWLLVLLLFSVING